MRLLDTINSPEDLKRLDQTALPTLAQEIRQELIGVVSTLGGHLASSLGAVELCLGLHCVFNAPEDQLVWDMGYQAYTHKLLTGRKHGIHTLKQLGGLSGFCNKDESPYDLFTTGHGGTCLSTAMGLAVAANQQDAQRRVVAIIGDASLGEGMALEALNHIGHVKPNLLVILNDNKMSIAKPVGALSRYLNRIITNPLYNKIRRDLEKFAQRLPRGERLVHFGRKMEESLKGLLVPGLLFEELGFRYVGPIDGHNVDELIATLKNVKRMKGPILLHVLTLKGKGYRPAEEDPERFHKIDPFEPASGQPKQRSKAQGSRLKAQDVSLQPSASSLQPSTFTDAFSEALIDAGERDNRVIAITAAMPEGTGVASFARRFPERYFDVGMAEQHAVGLAAGLARMGMRPVVAIYSTFMQRAFDQIMHEMSLQNLPIVLAIDRGGLVGEDGPTHHGVFDLAYLRIFPNLVVLSPKDPEELRAMLRFALQSKQPVALRYARGGILCGEPMAKSAPIQLGKAELLQSGSDVTLFAVGSLVYPALEVASQLQHHGIDAAVVNARFVKPLDTTLIRQHALHTGAIVTLEEAQIAGGFGSAVSEALDGMGLSSVPLHRIGLPDGFIEHGKRSELLQIARLDTPSLTRRVLDFVTGIRTSEPLGMVRSAPDKLVAHPAP